QAAPGRRDETHRRGHLVDLPRGARARQRRPAAHAQEGTDGRDLRGQPEIAEEGGDMTALRSEAAEPMSKTGSGQEAPKKDHGVLYTGRARGRRRPWWSATKGVGETLSSVVGYPKDVVSRKLLKRDVLFGKGARERRLSLKL